MSSLNNKSRFAIDDVSDDFRAVIRKASSDSGKTVKQYIHSVFERLTVADGKSKNLTFSAFEEGVRSLKKNFSLQDIQDIFEECDSEGQQKISLDSLIEFCEKTVLKAKALSLKLRNAVCSHFKGEKEYRSAFSTISGGGKFADFEAFNDFAEEYLQMNMSEYDARTVFGLFDIDGDGKISVDDFLNFMLPQKSEAMRALQIRNPEAIVDIKITENRLQDDLIRQQGYLQVIPDLSLTTMRGSGTNSVFGTFGRGINLWIWKRKQGTCSGRLKPIIDIILQKTNTSSALVLSGYTCIPHSVSGQFIWIRRALTEEEDKDAIMDLYVTIAKSSSLNDHLLTGPGVGWLRVDGNFSRGVLSNSDAVLWYRPARQRQPDAQFMSPIRNVVLMTDERQKTQLVTGIRIGLRNYIPTAEIATLCNYIYRDSSQRAAGEEEKAGELTASLSPPRLDTAKHFDFAYAYHTYASGGGKVDAKMKKSNWHHMLCDVGIAIDKADAGRTLFYFDVSQNDVISREEYAQGLTLTDHEVDIAVEEIRNKLMYSIEANSKSRLKTNRSLSEVFHVLNTSNDRILSITEILNMASKLEVYLSEEESRKVHAIMDVDGDDRVEERDFITFMKKPPEVAVKKAHRLREAAASFRRWLARGSTGNMSTIPAQWKEMKRRHEKDTGKWFMFYSNEFPGYLTSEDIRSQLCFLGTRLSFQESRELCVLISGDVRGRIYLPELQNFMTRQCRNFGKLKELLEKDVLSPLIEAYREHRREVLSSNGEDPKLARIYKDTLQHVVTGVLESAIAAAPDDTPGVNPQLQEKKREGGYEIVPVLQLKRGIEKIMIGYETPQNLLPNEEEWACLAALTGTIVTDNDFYGIQMKPFLENLCSMIVGSLDPSKVEDFLTLDAVKKELQKMILEEAWAAGDGKFKNYQAAFGLFDANGNGVISLDEFRHMLLRLQIADQLQEGQLPALLAMFDKGKRGYITLDAFIAFVEDADANLVKIEKDDDDPDDDEELGLDSANAPVVITKREITDWLLWHVWKQCCRTEPTDPESLITELEAFCAEIEISSERTESVSARDLWNLLTELKLRGDMSRQRFDESIQFFYYTSKYDTEAEKKAKSKDGNLPNADTALIDFQSFCRYVVRMGRAFNAKVQEERKKFEADFVALWTALQKELIAMGRAVGCVAYLGRKGLLDIFFFCLVYRDTVYPDAPLRFERIFKRMDADGDGRITALEFKRGLKRLRCKDEKKWSRRKIRRLFQERESGREGYLLLSDLYSLVRGQPPENPDDDPEPEPDEDEEGTFGRMKDGTDWALMVKTTEALMHSIPKTASSESDHLDHVKQSIRKYLQRTDPEGKGTVTEDKFRAFIRRSGLQDRLTTSEVRRVVAKFRRRVAIKGSGPRGTIFIDYERFVRQLSLLKTDDDRRLPSIPLSKAEGILAKLQEACRVATTAGRPFLGLCTLCDPSNTGLITRSELILTCKMINFTISNDDIDCLKELLPSNAFSADGLIDYRELNWLIHHYTRHEWERQSQYLSYRSRHGMGSLPLYATPGYTTMMTDDLDYSRTILTPGGYFILPKKEEKKGDPPPPAAPPAPKPTYQELVNSLTRKIRNAIEERTSAWGGIAPQSFRRHFQIADKDATGWLLLSKFQSVLETIGVSLSPEELLTVKSQFGRGEDDLICYEELFQVIFRNGGWSLNETRNATETFAAPATMSTLPRVRLQEAIEEALYAFHSFDRTRRGVVDSVRFKEIILYNQLVNSEYQADRAAEEYACISDKSLVYYGDFLNSLESRAGGPIAMRSTTGSLWGAESTPFRRSGNMSTPFRRSSPTKALDDGDGLWPYSIPHIDKRFAEDSPRGRRENENLYASLNRFRNDNLDESRRLSIDVDVADDVSGYGSSRYPPIKMSDSVNVGRNRERRSIAEDSIYEDKYNSRGRGLSGSSIFRSPERSSSNRVAAPRSPPHKVGTYMWGVNTPFEKRGNPPSLKGGWVCAVCYYTENSSSAKRCQICDSPNIATDKNHQMRLQCPNCAYSNNGQFAEKCEMCGTRLV